MTKDKFKVNTNHVAFLCFKCDFKVYFILKSVLIIHTRKTILTIHLFQTRSYILLSLFITTLNVNVNVNISYIKPVPIF